MTDNAAGIRLSSILPANLPSQETSIRRVYTGLAFVLCAAWLYLISPQFLNDPDTFWHIRTGRDIWETGRFPVIDTYSHTYYGHPWIAKEWLSQLILYATHRIGGWNAVVALTVFALASTGALIFYFLSLRLNYTLALVVTLAAIYLSSQTYLARPHVFSFPIIVIWTEYLVRASDKGRAPSFWLIPLMTLWANLHGSFTVGFIISALAFLNFVEKDGFSNRGAIWAWVGFIVAVGVASAIHVYNIQPILTSLGVFGGNKWLTLPGEWKPVDALSEPIHEFALVGLAGLLLFAGLKLRAAKAVFVMFALHMFLTYLRFAYLFYFLIPLVCSYEVAAQHKLFGANPSSQSIIIRFPRLPTTALVFRLSRACRD